ncbi:MULTISPECIES: SDR family NAD(P)-dependent oxidoreductase [unclassified Dietzia]|uniref:SDR family NAD(P)-dependent oxidoreductase n=1 Tax=unclassified Dietzia TaxID=2617939 RepID=UPI000D21ED4B|nr:MULTISPECIES: SDR family oxidoreductase [unclassified Dietzia]AVZ40090.1 short-chain dehydrogenase [Dietzia sp. JS16-p6b]QGW25512.1 SDR family oxidoreductase [Dietzia sp. DQ12-45-1b]
MTGLRLDGRSFAVTGSSRGIGAAVADDLAGRGADVVLNGRDEAALRDRVAELSARSDGRITGVPGSAHEPAVAQSLLAEAARDGSVVSGLITCAGVAEPAGSSILTVSHADFEALMDAHLGSVFAPCRVFAPHFVAAGAGAIVTTSSFAWKGDYGGTGYPAGKGAVTSLTMAIAAELAEHGVRANVVCPGARTRLSSGQGYENQIRELGRRGMLDELSVAGALDPAGPEYVAPLYTYLVSELAQGVTGGVFAGSGGFIGRFPAPEAQILAFRDFHDSPPWTPEEIDGIVRS